MNVLARDEGLLEWQEVDHQLTGRLCGNTGSEDTHNKTVTCSEGVSGKYLVLQMTQKGGVGFSINELYITVADTGT